LPVNEVNQTRPRRRPARADVLAARATGGGAGLVVFMVVWLVGNRLTGQIWPPPVGPVLAMLVAVLAGSLVAWVMGARLVRSLAPKDVVAAVPRDY
jgi:hypothetical protein